MRGSVWLAVTLIAPGAAAQLPVPFPTTPTWESDRPGVSTGGAFADLDRDGAPDLVIANGNDIRRQSVVVYRNAGNGTFPTSPTWSSSDIDYHGHLDVGDVNGDGWPDVVVGVFLGPNLWGDPGRAKLYLNDGAGNLSATPVWTSGDRFMSFSVALGDVDLDGDLDLAVATGEPYYDPPDFDRVYLNRGGTFSAMPDWTSATRTHSMDVGWWDVDRDGDLDLAFAGASGPNRIYFNQGGVLQTTAGWASTDNGGSHNSNTLAFGDVDGDGAPDLAIADNSQLGGGRGTFRVYRNTGTTLTTVPWWESARFANGYTSAVAFHDFDLDGDLDLVAGGWWTPTVWFRNVGGTLPTTPTWQSARTSVVEALFFADVDRDGLRPVAGEVHAATGGRLFRLRQAPVHAVSAVRVDGQPVASGGYAFDPDAGWISFAATPLVDVRIDYVVTDAADLGVSNWDQDKGNYLFRRRPIVDVTQTRPPRVAFRGGEVIAWTDTVESTVAVPVPLAYSTGIRVPQQLGGILAPLYHIPVLYPAATTVALPQSLPLPPVLVPVLFGSYRYEARLIGPDGITVIAEASFPFDLVP
ncbi:MAG: VCBS repeat-containing protein [Planctomycetes bacterium]|nr:VCBS repeat-containing protein [Planctomycetota bacterium]